MRPLLPVLLLPVLLAACDRDPAAAAPSPGRTGPVAAAIPMPGELRVFGDWIVGCDNGRLCQMASLAPEAGPPAASTMAVLRQPGPAGAIDLSFGAIGDDAPVQPAAVTIDGRRLALPALNGAPAAAVARAMADGRRLAVIDARGRVRARLSLAGAAAALRWIDAEQGRAGTVTALVARGGRAAETVPAGPATPVIRAVAATGPGTAPTAAQLAAMRRAAACEDSDGSRLGAAETHALGHGATLVMLPCSTGAYNLSSALFVLRDGTVAPAPTDAPIGFDATPAGRIDRVPSIVNGRWQDGALTGDAKGRGLGDCGVRQTLVWDGSRLRLSEQAAMTVCRGNPDYLTTWRTQVVRP